MTKPIIVVKTCHSSSSKEILISNFLTSADIKVFDPTYLFTCNAASDWPRTFFTPRGICLAYHYFLEVKTHVITSKQAHNIVN